MKTTPIKLMASAVIAIALMSSCENNEGQPTEESNSWITVFNLTSERIDITSEHFPDTSNFVIEPQSNSIYVKISPGDVELSLSDESGNSILVESTELEDESFYSAFIYKTVSGELKLAHQKNFDSEYRSEAQPITGLQIHHLSSTMPPRIDVYDFNRLATVGHGATTFNRYILMKAHDLRFEESANEQVETTDWGGFVVQTTPVYAIWDSTSPEFVSMSYKGVITNSASPPGLFNSDLQALNPPTGSPNEVLIENFSRLPMNFRNKRGRVFAMVFFDLETNGEDPRPEARLIDLYDIEVQE